VKWICRKESRRRERREERDEREEREERREREEGSRKMKETEVWRTEVMRKVKVRRTGKRKEKYERRNGRDETQDTTLKILQRKEQKNEKKPLQHLEEVPER
jgi:hypothetical protein